MVMPRAFDASMPLTLWVNLLVTWCFDPSQPQRITLGPNINFILPPNDLCAEKLRDRLEFVLSSDVTPSGWLGSKHQLTNKLILPPSSVSQKEVHHYNRSDDHSEVAMFTIKWWYLQWCAFELYAWPSVSRYVTSAFQVTVTSCLLSADSHWFGHTQSKRAKTEVRWLSCFPDWSSCRVSMMLDSVVSHVE